MEIIRSIQQLELLRDEWNALADRLERPLLRHEWFASCASAFHAESDLHVAIVRRGGRLAAAAPLVRTRAGGIPRLQFLGMSSLFEPSGFLYDGDDALEELLRGLIAVGPSLDLQRVEEASAVCRLMPQLVRRPGLVVSRATRPSLSIPIRSGWNEYLKTLSSRITKNIPRLKARAAKLGPVKTETHAPTPDQVDGHMATVMAVEGSGWKARRGSSMLARPRMREFFSMYGRRAAENGQLRVSLLWFGERVAAVELWIEAYKRAWQLKIGYEDAFARDYPGLQLSMESIRSAFERKLDAYEFLGSTAAWEEQWNPEERAYRTLLVYPPTVVGFGGLAVDAFRFAEGRLARRFSRAAAQ